MTKNLVKNKILTLLALIGSGKYFFFIKNPVS